MAQTRPTNNEQLEKWMKRVLGYGFATRPSCPDHDAPFSWIADLYFDRESRVAVLGPRGGGKTLGSACLHCATGATREGYSIAHFGGTMQQALQCQEYIKLFGARPGVDAVFAVEPRATWAKWKTGAMLSIHTATEKQASGRHPHRKQADEFDMWSWEVWQKFLGMGIVGSGESVKMQTVYTSTRSRKYGLMHTLLQGAAEHGIRVYKYCIWDVKAACPECLKGKCELWEWCQGKHKDSCGHIPRMIIVDKALQMDVQTVRTELFCEEPTSHGLCWPTFDAISRDGSNVTAAAEYRPDWEVFWGCDDNYEQPRCIALCQEDPHTGFLHIFDEYYRSHRMASEGIQDILEDKERYPYKAPHYAIPDPTAKELHGALHRMSIPTFAPHAYRRAEGVKVARRWIQDARGTRMVLIHPRCVNIIRSISKHHHKELPASAEGKPQFSEEPEKHDDDHGADVLCYICWVRRSVV